MVRHSTYPAGLTVKFMIIRVKTFGIEEFWEIVSSDDVI